MPQWYVRQWYISSTSVVPRRCSGHIRHYSHELKNVARLTNYNTTRSRVAELRRLLRPGANEQQPMGAVPQMCRRQVLKYNNFFILVLLKGAPWATTDAGPSRSHSEGTYLDCARFRVDFWKGKYADRTAF